MAVTLAELQELNAFLNRCKRLRSIDMRQLVQGQVIHAGDANAWQAFASNPLRFLVLAGGEVQQRIWRIVEDGRA